MMKFECKNNVTDPLNRISKTIVYGTGPERMLALANECIIAINMRTHRSIDMNGAPFQPYKERGTYYAPVNNRPAGYPQPAGGRREHIKTGRPLKTVAYDGGYTQYKTAIGRGPNPQLSVSGEMLGDMVARSGKGWAEIYFATALSQAKAHGQHISGQFQFFGLDYATIDDVHRDIVSMISDSIKKENAGNGV